MKTKQQFPILLVEDDIVIAECYKAYLENEPIKWVHVETGAAALKYLQQAIPKAILLDLGLPDMNGMEIIKYVKQHRLNCAVIVLTAEDSIDVVVEVMRYGAFDFLKKPFEAARLISTLCKVIHCKKSRYLVNLNPVLPKPTKIKKYQNFIGDSPQMQKIYQRVKQIASSNVSVLVTGETGTGKDLCAEAIHKESQRRKESYMTLNCAAVPQYLLESEIFGYVKGAFTGADKDKPGIACVSDKGTLFLDEIGEMNLDLQSKLLRFVETGTFYQVGSRQLETVNVRFIAATNRNPYNEVKAGRFREDLYYRLKTISIHLPPLRERGDDILLLAQTFLKKYAFAEKKNFKSFRLGAEKVLLAYKWPGNVRQLLNVIRNMVLLNDGDIITTEMTLAALEEEPSCNPLETPPIISHPPPAEPIQETSYQKTSYLLVAITSGNALRSFKEMEKEILQKSIAYCGGNVEKTAKGLKIGPATIHRKKRQWTN
jgi:two-component system repressor protein LuxO